MKNILLIDDDERLASLLEAYFLRYDLHLLSATHPNDGLAALRTNSNIDLVILDIMLPDIDGFEVCRIIRQDSHIPILMLTARGDVMDRIVGLEIGADDYLAKPFEPRELVARIHNILKRLGEPHPQVSEIKPILKWQHLYIDTERYLVSLDNRKLQLTNKEYALLLLLAENPDKSFDRDSIMNKLSGIDAELFSRSVDILVSRLRYKLKPLKCIQTVWGKGYRFIPAHA